MVELTPLWYIPSASIRRHLGHLNFFIIRESTSIKEVTQPTIEQSDVTLSAHCIKLHVPYIACMYCEVVYVAVVTRKYRRAD